MPPEEEPDRSGEAGEEAAASESSSTEMIDRNRFLLHRLQAEIGRIKEQMARVREEALMGSRQVLPEADPEKILKEALSQLEKIQEGRPQEHPPAPEGPEEAARS